MIDELFFIISSSANYCDHATYPRMHSNYFHGSNIGQFRPRSPKLVLNSYRSVDDIDDSGGYSESNSSNSRFPSQSWDFLQVNIYIERVFF